MLELGVEAGQTQIHDNDPERSGEKENSRQLPQHPPEGLPGMLTERDRHVHLQIGVMQAVDAASRPASDATRRARDTRRSRE